MDTRSFRFGFGLTFLLASLAATLGGTRSAYAGDPAAEAALKEATAKVDELDKQVKQHLTVTTADDALRADIAAAAKLSNELSDAKLKGRCLDAIGTILRGTTHDDLERDALKALGTLANPDAGKYVVSYLRISGPKDAPPLLPDAIDCAAKIKSDATVNPLLMIVEKSDTLPLAVAALKALGNFGTSKAQREKILDTLVASVEKDRPGISYRWRGTPDARYKSDPRGIKTGEDARNRYEALAGEMCTSLNKLTGQNVASPEEWFELRKNYKSDLAHLFLN
jgi:hypothetical protein